MTLDINSKHQEIQGPGYAATLMVRAEAEEEPADDEPVGTPEDEPTDDEPVEDGGEG